ncbi:PhoH-like phosphate starvation-inducible [Pectobacterium phage vB_ParM-25]|uniref:PhoH-like protein domain-containing protein n=1 Tax=Serratia phage vB_SmaM_Yaphecito TaxID=2777368 RepID=A0A7T3NC46_9CAUD|nr:hypothetical protein [Serratia phage vB_SmaM_Yaphecito]UQT03664.1 phosphate starvation-inducible protein [Serratia phage vB_SmaM-Kodama]URG14057.1 PhoH-like phosphate starvation-inducible [Pectobacterium phage vB_ParM-25]
MGRQKAATVKRRDVRKAKRQNNRGIDNLVEFPTAGGHDVIGMAKEKRDTSPLEPRNDNQAQYLNALELSNIIVSTGSAGAGKTYICAAWAADRLLAKETDRIIVTRPVLTAEEDLGFLPGDISEKFRPFFRPVYDVLRKRLGNSFLEYCLKPMIEKVEIAPFAYMRGRTFDDAVVILDEAQNVTVNQMRLFITRIGMNSTVIINGDIEQCDLPNKNDSGLLDLIRRIEERDIDIPVIKFVKDDCVRSPICQLGLEIYS